MISVGLERRERLDKNHTFNRYLTGHDIMLVLGLGIEISSIWAGVGR